MYSSEVIDSSSTGLSPAQYLQIMAYTMCKSIFVESYIVKSMTPKLSPLWRARCGLVRSEAGPQGERERACSFYAQDISTIASDPPRTSTARQKSVSSAFDQITGKNNAFPRAKLALAVRSTAQY